MLKDEVDNLIAAIDIGSSKIVTMIAEVDEKTRGINILGSGVAETKNGIKQGVIQNIEAVVEAIANSAEKAENQASYEVDDVYIGVSSNSIETINADGAIGISGADKEITNEDIDNVIRNAQAVDIPMDREIIHILPQRYSVDGHDWIKNPLGMVGTRLQCQVHILTSSIASTQNIEKSLSRASIKARQLVLQNLANAKALLTDDEKELGVLLIDIGAETAKVSVYFDDAPFYNKVLPIGGKYITSDISKALRIQQSAAEKIKISYGVSDFNYVDDSEEIEIPLVGGRDPKKMQRKNLVYIIRPRVEEIFTMIKNDLKENNMLDKIASGVVLTGGTANLPGIVEVCQDVFDTQARVGTLQRFQGLGDLVRMPEYSVAVGLILWGYERMQQDGDLDRGQREDSGNGFLQTIKNMFRRMF